MRSIRDHEYVCQVQKGLESLVNYDYLKEKRLKRTEIFFLHMKIYQNTG